ncbi:DUF4149 domain-containing protein [Phormidium yuhuli AB48]|uniref:DUF4149 domain-containing protein n=1 Tax=Phormidium yuhuli AB48 TaxID=2940671 RepID=A0ABY5AQY2_9CYAN|nr:DUF4149 domain-containing protein [Phormidium yuhuli]USR91306.1 DUF4149 domain-containing protein [Phormidium yuhuli AB48]
MTALSAWIRKTPSWQAIISLSLALWFGASLVLDFVMMPGMYSMGMMSQPDFASMGYSTFERFNHLELLFGAIALTGVLVLNQQQHFFGSQTRKAIMLSTLLLGIAIAYTYLFTPQMSAMGMSLTPLEPLAEFPPLMETMQQGYWVLEVLKLASAWILLRLCHRQMQTP